MYNTPEYLHLLGGVDINPAIYGEEMGRFTQTPDNYRDSIEIEAVKKAIRQGKPIIGVCRGAQLLCALNGGKLYQHAYGHHKDHAIITKTGKVIENVTSCHHQIMRLDDSPNYDLIAWARFETVVFDQEENPYTLEKSPEVVWFPETKSLAIQSHPEWEKTGSEVNLWINGLIKELMGFDNFF